MTSKKRANIFIYLQKDRWAHLTYWIPLSDLQRNMTTQNFLEITRCHPLLPSTKTCFNNHNGWPT